MGKEFSDFLASEGIIHETSTPDTPQQNGLAERMQQTIWSGICTILHHLDMKNGFWSEALAVIVHIVNCALWKQLDWRTPHEVLTGQVLNVAYFCIFGCCAWVHNNKGKKLDPKGLPIIFVSYEPSSKGYRLWDPLNHKIIISSDVTFDETLLPNKPADKPVSPPTISDHLELQPTKMSEGKWKEQVTFVDIPEVFILHEELGPPHAALLTPQVPKPITPAPGPQIQWYIPPQCQAE